MGLYESRTVYAPAPGRDVLAWMDDASLHSDRWSAEADQCDAWATEAGDAA